MLVSNTLRTTYEIYSPSTSEVVVKFSLRLAVVWSSSSFACVIVVGCLTKPEVLDLKPECFGFGKLVLNSLRGSFEIDLQ